MSGLSLDTVEGLRKGGKRGPAYLPSQPEASPLLNSLRHTGELKMPPGGPIPESERRILEAWALAGAAPRIAGRQVEDPLWALRPVRMPAVPRPRTQGWAKTPVDAFILSGLERRGLRPSPVADRRTLIRRASLDLTGLPPTPEEVGDFLQDRRPGAWDRVVDRLLADPHYGERMALFWLDLARYADSDGYHDDTTRLMWRYRDYVIQSFNRNKPFDVFTREQIAGDLLPNATLEQKVASAFHRCGPTTSEGGAIPEEVLARYAAERVVTTGQVWLGLTVQCGECHDHKYDPFTMRDFYSLVAYFNQVPEQALYRGTDAPPTLLIPTPEQEARLAELSEEIRKAEEEARPRPSPPDPAAEAMRTAEARKRVTALQNERAGIERSARLRVMQDVPERRPTFILLRGDYRAHGEPVQPAVPAALGDLPAGSPPNRLALAAWLTDPANPLPARVTVNRLWQMLFGAGIVRTADDFGTRGDRPTHPELLDWLASDFVRSGWNVKALLRKLVTSAVYLQSSAAGPAGLKADPDGRWLSRMPRVRLPAELVRDNALAIAGLLDRNRPVGGLSVHPYQPGDLWRELSAGDQVERGYVQDHGPNLYRRGLYTFWKRSILYPSFAVFDAPKREVCTGRRPITNTPLQALVTLNDTTYVEAARVFADRILSRGGETTASRLRYGFEVALARPPRDAELRSLAALLQEAGADYSADPPAAEKLAQVGEWPRNPARSPRELAAWTCVCNALLNLDETITRE